MAHPVDNIRGAGSRHLEGRHIVLAVCGSIAAVKTVELARELIRHGAQVTAVMSRGATRIVHPDALHFATGRPAVVRLSGAVEHVGLLGDVPEKADLLLVAPATANTVAKMALGVDDTPVTTCATVAFGTGVPVVVAPAMHEAMLRHDAVQDHARTLRQRGVDWVEPVHEEHKAKMADPQTIVEQVIHRLAQRHGPMAHRRCLVVGGATAEPVDDVRILTNRSSGQSAIVIARELRRLGADVALWYGHASTPVPDDLAPATWRFGEHAQLITRAAEATGFDQVWVPAAIADYTPERAIGKIPSGQDSLQLHLRPADKVIPVLRQASPGAELVAFKAEAQEDGLEAAARRRLEAYGAKAVVANAAASFGSDRTRVLLVTATGCEAMEGRKQEVLARLVAQVAP